MKRLAGPMSLKWRVLWRMAKGWFLSDIFAEHQARLPVGYKQFAKYVQRFSDHTRPRPVGWTPRRGKSR